MRRKKTVFSPLVKDQAPAMKVPCLLLAFLVSCYAEDVITSSPSSNATSEVEGISGNKLPSNPRSPRLLPLSSSQSPQSPQVSPQRQPLRDATSNQERSPQNPLLGHSVQNPNQQGQDLLGRRQRTALQSLGDGASNSEDTGNNRGNSPDSPVGGRQFRAQGQRYGQRAPPAEGWGSTGQGPSSSDRRGSGISYGEPALGRRLPELGRQLGNGNLGEEQPNGGIEQPTNYFGDQGGNRGQDGGVRNPRTDFPSAGRQDISRRPNGIGRSDAGIDRRDPAFNFQGTAAGGRNPPGELPGSTVNWQNPAGSRRPSSFGVTQPESRAQRHGGRQGGDSGEDQKFNYQPPRTVYRGAGSTDQEGGVGHQRRPASVPEEYVYRPYSFNYISEADDGMFTHQQTADNSGRVVGSYAMSLEDGRKRIVEYIADENGFRASVDTNEPGTSFHESPADVRFYSSSAGDSRPGRQGFQPIRPQDIDQPGRARPSTPTSRNTPHSRSFYSSAGVDQGVPGLRDPIDNGPQNRQTQGVPENGAFTAGRPYSGTREARPSVRGSAAQDDNVMDREPSAPLANRGIGRQNTELYAQPLVYDESRPVIQYDMGNGPAAIPFNYYRGANYWYHGN